MGVKTDIINYCLSLGIDSVGFIKCRKFDELRQFYEERKASNLENEFEEKDIEKRINPLLYLEEGKTIISIGFPYLALKKKGDIEILGTDDQDEKDINGKHNNDFSVYTRGLDYHYVLNKYLREIAKIIERYGGKAEIFVDSNTLPERYIAYLAGVGFIGKNNLVINKKYGSYIFLGEIITDLEIYDEDKGTFNDISSFRECGECTICYKECPTKAINSVRKNCNICLSYITQKKDLKDWEMEKLDGRMFGCDSCQSKCPYNENIEYSNIEEFKSFDFMDNVNEEFIINMNNSEFKESFKKTSCGWRGKNILKRNALIRKALYLKDKSSLDKVKFESPYLQEYLNRLLHNNKKN